MLDALVQANIIDRTHLSKIQAIFQDVQDPNKRANLLPSGPIVNTKYMNQE